MYTSYCRLVWKWASSPQQSPTTTNAAESGGVVNKQIEKGLLLSVRVIFLNRWILGKVTERGCLVHFARLANILLKDEDSARDNHVVACNFAKYSPIKKISLRDSARNLFNGVINNPTGP